MTRPQNSWTKRAKRFWELRQRRSSPDALTGYLLDESPSAIGKRRFDGEWRQLSRRLAAKAGPKNAALDLGCGTGVWLAELAEIFKNVEGWDFAPAMVAASRATLKKRGVKNAVLKCGQISSRKGRGVFDLIMAGGVLMYTPDSAMAQLLENLVRLAKDDALVVFRESSTRGTSWAREGLALRGGLTATPKQKADLDYVAIYRSREELMARMENAGLTVLEIRRNRHYKFSDLTEDWLRRFDFLLSGRLSKNTAAAERAARWIYRARFLFLYPEYIWRGILGLHPWKIENFWFICTKRQND